MSDDLSRTDERKPNGFSELVKAIRAVDERLSAQAARAVNASLTIRNWLIGFQIQEYEQHGQDRATYGERLLELLAKELKAAGVSRTEARELRRYRLFYQLYPQIRDSLSPEFSKLLSWPEGQVASIRETLSPEFHKPLPGNDLGDGSEIRETRSPISGSRLISSLSFSHICELLTCETEEKRAFYEAECIKGCWSIREFRRHIASLLYERSELSINKQKLIAQLNPAEDSASPQLTIRDPYIFEFLGLTPLEVIGQMCGIDDLMTRP
jgi:hypothetical protein